MDSPLSHSLTPFARGTPGESTPFVDVPSASLAGLPARPSTFHPIAEGTPGVGIDKARSASPDKNGVSRTGGRCQRRRSSSPPSRLGGKYPVCHSRNQKPPRRIAGGEARGLPRCRGTGRWGTVPRHARTGGVLWSRHGSFGDGTAGRLLSARVSTRGSVGRPTPSLYHPRATAPVAAELLRTGPRPRIVAPALRPRGRSERRTSADGGWE
jgi:hypothetical protein